MYLSVLHSLYIRTEQPSPVYYVFRVSDAAGLNTTTSADCFFPRRYKQYLLRASGSRIPVSLVKYRIRLCGKFFAARSSGEFIIKYGTSVTGCFPPGHICSIISGSFRWPMSPVSIVHCFCRLRRSSSTGLSLGSLIRLLIWKRISFHIIKFFRRT